MSAPAETVLAWIGLGGNLGEPHSAISNALAQLDDDSGIDVEAVSSFYRTAPIGITGQPDFINAVARIRTADEPQVLLEKLLTIEAHLGRVRTEQQFGPRVIDLDLLLFGGVQMDTARLTLPHPRMHLRRFVLEPLFELEGDLTLPGGRALSHYLAQARDQSAVLDDAVKITD